MASLSLNWPTGVLSSSIIFPSERIFFMHSSRPFVPRDSRARNVWANKPWLFLLLMPLTSCSFNCSCKILTTDSTCLNTLAFGFLSLSSASKRSFSTCIVIVSSCSATVCACLSSRSLRNSASAALVSASCLPCSFSTSSATVFVAFEAASHAAFASARAPASSAFSVFSVASLRLDARASASEADTVSSRDRARKAWSLSPLSRSAPPFLPTPISDLRRRMSIRRPLRRTSSERGHPSRRLPRPATVKTHIACIKHAISSQASLAERRDKILSSGCKACEVCGSHTAAASSTCVRRTARRRNFSRARAAAAARIFRSSVAPTNLSWSSVAPSN
mmetsp:Transcript_111196/g.287427  ORF Transcript_111196/g.287427 Transcript_111196/m.287427 type:complete len:334 (-) Transcript_111196:1461-2462(-)